MRALVGDVQHIVHDDQMARPRPTGGNLGHPLGEPGTQCEHGYGVHATVGDVQEATIG
jgi:hypothetical protein